MRARSIVRLRVAFASAAIAGLLRDWPVHPKQEDCMNANSTQSPAQDRNLLAPILAGGLIAGTMDLTAAFIIWGWTVPRAIASGLLGPAALHGGAAIWTLGVFLHFFIALSAAAIYFFASRRLLFLKQNPLVCGLFYGIAVFLVMNLVVKPLSASPYRNGPFTLFALIQGLLVHMFCIGLPIAYSIRKFSK